MNNRMINAGRHDGEGFIMPPPLVSGDTVALIAPSGWIMPEFTDGACERLSQLGWRVAEGRHLRGREGTYSATVANRLADLRDAMLNPEVKAVFCGRGGYGAVQLIDGIDRRELRANPKWLVGYSDITALHAMMHSAGIMSIHAPMARHFTTSPPDDEAVALLADILSGRLDSLVFDGTADDRCGEAAGVLAGGNLAVMSALCGTPFDIVTDGCILFMEDVGEPAYRVERMMWQLRLSGALDRISGLIVGQFTGESRPLNGLTATEVVADMATPYRFPVVFNAPVGHVADNRPLVEGAMVKMSVTPCGTTLTYL